MSDKRNPSWPVRVLLGVLIVGWVGVSAAQTRPVVPLPPNVKQIATDRYVSPMRYRQTIRWLKNRWSTAGQTVVFQTIVDLPGVVASHAKVSPPRGGVRGVNVNWIGSTVQIFLIR